jgi:lysozyme family protein
MSSSNFPRAFEIVIGAEGGYVNDPNDPGGETKYGISKRVYPNEDIPNLTLDHAKDLYHRDYWLPAGCDALAYPMDVIVFDTAVNQGVSVATQVRGFNPVYALSYRAMRYVQTKNFDKYGRGWMNRLFALAQKVFT